MTDSKPVDCELRKLYELTIMRLDMHLLTCCETGGILLTDTPAPTDLLMRNAEELMHTSCCQDVAYSIPHHGSSLQSYRQP